MNSVGRDRFISNVHFALGVLLVISFVFLYGFHHRNNSLAAQAGLGKGKAFGAWEWRTIPEISGSGDGLKKAKADGVNKIYLSVNEPTDTDIGQLQAYIKQASKNGISVDALAGDKDWATPDKRYLMEQMVDFVADYNKQSRPDSRFSGLQFDVEAYNLPDFPSNQQSIMSDYLTSVRDISGKWDKTPATTGLGLSFTVPFWLDGDNNYAKKVSWEGKQNYPTFLLINILSGLKHPYVVVMDYRNHAEGPNGSITHAKGEIDYAQNNNASVKIIIGQEVSYVEPASITFYGKDRDYIIRQVSLISRAFENKTVFQGIAFNDFKSYERFLK